MNNRKKDLEDWITRELGINDYELTIASEDASFRQYFRIKYNGTSRIIMDAPVDQEDCLPFLEVNKLLIRTGVNVPVIERVNLEKGFALLTDFGDVSYLERLNNENVDTLYQDAMSALSIIQLQADMSHLPHYDQDLLLSEMKLFRDWLLGRHLNMQINSNLSSQLDVLFDLLIDNALSQPRVFVHRDYHSRNLMYLEKNNPGIIDFQDAVQGPVTYDLVSLLKDCYIKWPRDRIVHWASSYCEKYYKGQIDKTQFLNWFDLMGVQRHLKASGIFARLFHRDGKSGFLQDIPRTLSYITDLQNEIKELDVLSNLIIDEVLPRLNET